MRRINPTAFAQKHVMILLVCLQAAVPAFGQSGGQYELNWHTIDGGGGQSSGGPYVLTGTIGQPDADWSSGGDYEVLGGFWPGGPLCFVGFDDFARFAEYWWLMDLGADLNEDVQIDFRDVEYFADFWLGYCPYNWPLK